MPGYRIPILVWQDYEGLFTACPVEPTSELVGTSTSLRDAVAQVKSYLEYAYAHDAWLDEPEISKERLEFVPVTVRPVYVVPDGRSYPCDELLTLKIPCVVGERVDRVQVCSLPTLGMQFDFYSQDSFEQLVKEHVRAALANRTPAELLRFLPHKEFHLEKVHVRLKKRNRNDKPLFEPQELKAVADPLTSRAVRRRFNPAWMREPEVRELTELLQREQASILLIGERGAGKTTLLVEAVREVVRHERMRRKSKSEDVEKDPPPVSEHRFYMTSAARLIAGMQYLGEWQQRCETIVDELGMIRGVLCVENLLDLVRTGGTDAGDSVASFFRTYTQHGEMRLVGEVTPAELNACDRLLPGFSDAFQKIVVEPLTAENAVSALEKLLATSLQRHSSGTASRPSANSSAGEKSTSEKASSKKTSSESEGAPSENTDPLDAQLEEADQAVRQQTTEDTSQNPQAANRKQVRLEAEPGIVETTYRLHRRFLPYLTLPGPAANFIDELVENVANNRLSSSDEDDTNPQQRERELELLDLFSRNEKRTTITESLDPDSETDQRELLRITSDNIRREFARRTGLPDLFLRDDIPLDFETVYSTLSERVMGQESACQSAATVITTFKAGLNDPNRPVSVQLFCGPTGVGKTQLAREISKFCFGHGEETDRLVRLDMSEYSGWNAAARLLQRSDGRPGALIERVRQQPFVVLLLDEIEKASHEVFDVLLNVFEEGTLTDTWGRRTHFQSAMIIMTSNLGADSLRRAGFATTVSPTWEREVERFFRPEFINRIDEIVTFDPLAASSIQQIARRELQALNEREGLHEFDRKIVATDRLVKHIAARGFDARYGARPLQRYLEAFVVAPLSRFLLENSSYSGTIELDCDDAGDLKIRELP